MKRMSMLLGSLLVCSCLSGCTNDTQGDAINGVMQQMRLAAGDVNAIKDEVEKALKKHDQDKKPLDLTEAANVAKKLGVTGKALQEVKVKMVDSAKVIDKDEREELERRYKSDITSAFNSLLEAQKNLNDVLQRASAVDAEKVEELRTAIRQAEAPFQALTRQS